LNLSIHPTKPFGVYAQLIRTPCIKEWTFDKSLDELLYQLRKDDVIGRMWAASEIIKFKDNLNIIDSLIDCAMNDPFWAVRKSAVETLGEIQRKEHIGFFKERSKDKNSKVRVSALKALGDYKNSEFLEFLKERFKKDDSYLAQAEALRAMGKCGNRTLIPFLKEAATMRSPRNVIKKAAEWALNQINEK